MEGAAPENASRNRNRRRAGRRRKYPALKDQKICLLELIPPGADRVPGPSRAQTVPNPNRAQTTGPSHPLAIPCPSRAQTPGPSHPQTVHGPSSANTALGSSHAQTLSDQLTGSVIGQEVEGVIDGTFQDGFLISIKIGEMTLKGVAYEPDLAVEGQTVQQQNNNDVQESQGHDQMEAPMNGEGGQVVREVEATSLKLPKHISSQLEAETVRTVQPRSRIGNSGGGTSSDPTKHQDKDQARDVRGRGKGVKIELDLN